MHVGKHIMDNALLGFLKGKTIILITHAIHYLKYVDHIFVMEQGKVVLQGNYESLKQDPNFNSLLHKLEERIMEIKEEKFSDIDQEWLKEDKKTHENVFDSVANNFKDSFSDFGSFNTIPTDINNIKKYEDIIMEEDRKKGALSLSTYMGYINLQGGLPFALLVLISNI